MACRTLVSFRPQGKVAGLTYREDGFREGVKASCVSKQMNSNSNNKAYASLC